MDDEKCEWRFFMPVAGPDRLPLVASGSSSRARRKGMVLGRETMCIWPSEVSGQHENSKYGPQDEDTLVIML
jgi:hypothetical protein